MITKFDKSQLPDSLQNPIQEAPKDGKAYARKDGQWDPIVDETGNVDDVLVNGSSVVVNRVARITLPKVDLSNYYTKTESDIWLAQKVDKIPGKGLSTNDYTNLEKEALNRINSATPSVASASNKLVDTAALNTAIQRNNANRVTFNSTGDGFPSRLALKTATSVYHSGSLYTPTIHDYAIVMADEGAPSPYTGGQTQFEYSGSSWEFAFGINERPFTVAEEAAIESGITSTKVSNYDNHITNTSNPHNTTKAQVGLGNVDNTSDIAKPISNATQTALDAKADNSNVVHTSGDEIVYGTKTFATTPSITNQPTSPSHATNKLYVDNSLSYKANQSDLQVEVINRESADSAINLALSKKQNILTAGDHITIDNSNPNAPVINAVLKDMINHNDLSGRNLLDQHPITSITGLENALNSKADLTKAVLLTTNQTIDGTKTFDKVPILPNLNPTLDDHATRKKYVDDQVLTRQQPIVAGENIVLDDTTIPGKTIVSVDAKGDLVTEAPKDGELYGRKDGAWQQFAIPTPQEIDLSSQIDGVTDTFIINQQFDPSNVVVYYNGQRLYNLVNYVYYDASQTIITKFIPEVGDDLHVIVSELDPAFPDVSQTITDVLVDGNSAVRARVARLALQPIRDSVTNEATKRAEEDELLHHLLDDETDRARKAEDKLASDIAVETTNRTNADTTLQTNITNEAATRATADTNETNARTSADTGLSNRIDALSTSLDNYYTEAEADALLDKKANVADVPAEAPSDGKLYGRKDKTWVEAQAAGDYVKYETDGSIAVKSGGSLGFVNSANSQVLPAVKMEIAPANKKLTDLAVGEDITHYSFVFTPGTVIKPDITPEGFVKVMTDGIIDYLRLFSHNTIGSPSNILGVAYDGTNWKTGDLTFTVNDRGLYTNITFLGFSDGSLQEVDFSYIENLYTGSWKPSSTTVNTDLGHVDVGNADRTINLITNKRVQVKDITSSKTEKVAYISDIPTNTTYVDRTTDQEIEGKKEFISTIVAVNGIAPYSDNFTNIGTSTTRFADGYFAKLHVSDAPTEDTSVTNKLYVDSKITGITIDETGLVHITGPEEITGIKKFSDATVDKLITSITVTPLTNNTVSLGNSSLRYNNTYSNTVTANKVAPSELASSAIGKYQTGTFGKVVLDDAITDANQASTKKYVDDSLANIQTEALTFEGFVSTTQPTTNIKEGYLWFNASDVTTSFPWAVKTYTSGAWSSTTSNYTPSALDAWSKDDGTGWYYFGGHWNRLDFSGSVFNSTQFDVVNSNVNLKAGGITNTELASGIDGAKVNNVVKTNLSSTSSQSIGGNIVIGTDLTAGKVHLSNLTSLADNDAINKKYVDDHKNNTSNPHSVTAAQVGLGNVNNTSDANKPISIATQGALDGKLDKVTTTPSILYGTNSSNAQTTVAYDQSASANKIVQRNANADVPVRTVVPTTDNSAIGAKQVNDNYVNLSTSQTVAGVKTFSSNPLSSASQSTDNAALTRRDYVLGLDSTNVKLSGPQEINGLKTFTVNPLSTAAQSTDVRALTRKDYVDGLFGNVANNTDVVHKSGPEEISGEKTFIVSPIVPTPTTSSAATVAATKEYVDAAVNSHISDKANPHSVTKGQIGLGNVDNTSDVNKPISNATQNALNNKLPTITGVRQVYTTDASGNQNSIPYQYGTAEAAIGFRATTSDGNFPVLASVTGNNAIGANQVANNYVNLSSDQTVNGRKTFGSSILFSNNNTSVIGNNANWAKAVYTNELWPNTAVTSQIGNASSPYTSGAIKNLTVPETATINSGTLATVGSSDTSLVNKKYVLDNSGAPKLTLTSWSSNFYNAHNLGNYDVGTIIGFYAPMNLSGAPMTGVTFIGTIIIGENKTAFVEAHPGDSAIYYTAAVLPGGTIGNWTTHNTKSSSNLTTICDAIPSAVNQDTTIVVLDDVQISLLYSDTDNKIRVILHNLGNTAKNYNFLMFSPIEVMSTSINSMINSSSELLISSPPYSVNSRYTLCYKSLDNNAFLNVDFFTKVNANNVVFSIIGTAVNK